MQRLLSPAQEEKLRAEFLKAAEIALSSGISPPKYECAECKDTGWLNVEKPNGYRAAKRCKCHEWRRLQKHKASSNIDFQFEHSSLENYEPWNESTAAAKRKALAYVSDFNSGKVRSIAFLGSVGAGKTHLGIGILQALLSGRTAVLYAPYREMLTRLKSNVLDEEAYYRYLGRYTNVNVLFIDDLYKGVSFEKKEPVDLKYLYDVINERYRLKNATIITSEYTPAELCDANEAIGSRILEMCGNNIHVFKGKNQNFRLREFIE